MKFITTLLCLGTLLPAHAGLEDLLISEVSVKPAEAEYIEIHNSGTSTIDLSDVYLTDATFANGNQYYYQLVEGNGGGGDFADFYARFPDGASIEPGEYQSVGLNGSDDFFINFNLSPTYELYEDGISQDSIPDMREATSGSINNQGGLTDSGEVVVLLYWDGTSDLIQDLDYVLWGDKAEAIDKTGISIDGPDVDSDDSTFFIDTAIVNQDIVANSAHALGNSWLRSDLTEGTEVTTGGNGISGQDETSENISVTFTEGPADPAGDIFVFIEQFIINEVDAVSNDSDFIELFGNGNTSTDGYTLVLYDGVTDLSTAVISLDGLATDSNGYLLINYALEDGADAVALYVADATNFMVGEPITLTDLMDAVVYDSGQADDNELLSLLNPGQPQVNEAENGNALTESLIRCTNGSGGQLNTSSFKAFTPSPGNANSGCLEISFETYYDTVVTTGTQIDFRDSIHDIIDDHVVFPYSSGAEDTWDILAIADEDPQLPGQVWMIYKNNNYTWQGGGMQAYNREHTWPQSYGFSADALGDDNAARTDTHHLMLSDVGYNSDRGNLYFDDCSSGCNSRITDAHENPNTTQTDTIGGGVDDINLFDTNSFEVWDFRKGDVARAMFYMDVRYAGDTAGEVDLQLTDNASLINTGGPYMGLLATLLEWHAADPVDDIERNRNNFIFTKQLNRNPFIDHPEWVECVFVDFTPCEGLVFDRIFTNGFE